ncbi:MAG: hypothetical protein LBP25_04935 [Tannerellaceae bacterium]|nr:hypothetical protein [Tannerellaceae bacterium]
MKVPKEPCRTLPFTHPFTTLTIRPSYIRTQPQLHTDAATATYGRSPDYIRT